MNLRKLLCTLLLAPSLALAADVAYSPPVGGTKVTFNQGSRYSGMSFVNRAVVRGSVSASSGSVLTLTSGAGNIGASLTAGTAYYVEFVSGSPGTYIGDRFEVDVVATQASANNTLTITPSSLNNTLASLPATQDLAGYSVVIRPHVTIGQLFGTRTNQLMQGSTIVSSADQVLFYNTQAQAFETYYFLRNGAGTVVQWTKVGGGSTNRDNVIIPPGVGVVVVRNAASPVTLTWSGDIRLNHFAQPLVAGNNLISQPFPVDASPFTRSMTVANGLIGSTAATTADKIQFPSGGAFRTYYLLRNASGTIEQWTLVGGGSTNRNNELLFPLNGAVILNKISADSNYVVPNTISL